jgi:hypothetical protein
MDKVIEKNGIFYYVEPDYDGKDVILVNTEFTNLDSALMYKTYSTVSYFTGLIQVIDLIYPTLFESVRRESDLQYIAQFIYSPCGKEWRFTDETLDCFKGCSRPKVKVFNRELEPIMIDDMDSWHNYLNTVERPEDKEMICQYINEVINNMLLPKIRAYIEEEECIYCGEDAIYVVKSEKLMHKGKYKIVW